MTSGFGKCPAGTASLDSDSASGVTGRCEPRPVPQPRVSLTKTPGGSFGRSFPPGKCQALPNQFVCILWSGKENCATEYCVLPSHYLPGNLEPNSGPLYSNQHLGLRGSEVPAPEDPSGNMWSHAHTRELDVPACPALLPGDPSPCLPDTCYSLAHPFAPWVGKLLWVLPEVLGEHLSEANKTGAQRWSSNAPRCGRALKRRQHSR